MRPILAKSTASTGCLPRLRDEETTLPPLKLKQGRQHVVPTLDGGQSPFGGELPNIFRKPLDRSQLPQRRVAFSAPTSRETECGTPLDLPAAPSTAPTERRKAGKSLGPPRHSPLRSSARHKTWSSPALAMEVPASSATSRSTRYNTERGGSPCPSAVNTVASLPSVKNEGSWTKGRSIGAGSYGSVFRALDNKTGAIFAVKKAKFNIDDDDDKRLSAKLQEELSICKELRHPNIISYLGHELRRTCLYIYMEYAPGGSMASILGEFGALGDGLLIKATVDAAQGLDYLHTRSPPVVHRDIKCANILVDLDFTCKLADFGCSKRSTVTTTFTTVGSIPWMAPEVIHLDGGHGRKADIWSFGCTMIEMATADKPWGSEMFDNFMCALRHIGYSRQSPPVPPHLPDAAAELIRSCVSLIPEERPTASEILEHEFLTLW